MAHDDGADLIIDCDTCTVRGRACDDCVVTVFLDLPGRAIEGAQTDRLVALDPAEAQALDALAAGGLLPPLRLTPRAETGWGYPQVGSDELPDFGVIWRTLTSLYPGMRDTFP